MSYKPFNPFVPPPRPQPREEPVVDKKGRPIDPRKLQRKQITRFLVNPEFGSGLQDLKQTHGMFLRLVSNVFLQIGLIDAAYPGISDEKALTLRSLLSYAYRNLEYTREGMPRVLMFYSFIASMAAMGLAIAMFAVQVTSNAGGRPHMVRHDQPKAAVQQLAPAPYTMQHTQTPPAPQAVPQTVPQPVPTAVPR